MNEQTDPISEDQAVLMRLLNFAPDDLIANRAGNMSELQRYTLRVRRRRAIIIGLAIIFTVAFIASLLIFLGAQRDSLILRFIGIGLALCNVMLGWVFARHWIRLTTDIRTGHVQTARGPLERVIKPVNRRVMNYMIRVESAEVFVPKEAFDVFAHRISYALYRAPATGMLLAAERLEP